MINDAHGHADTVAQIEDLAQRLETLKARLGSEYWTEPEVLRSQAQLHRLLGLYSAWAEDGPPLHQRARQAAQLESRFAHLLWAGRETDAG